MVSVEEYLSTDYSPDCDYVDGVLEDRNVGEKSHSKLQAALAAHLYGRRHEFGIGIQAFLAQRIQITPTRYRVVDLCITIGEPEEQIFTAAPFLCIEVLSPKDRMSRVLVKIADYLQMGVPFVWPDLQVALSDLF